MLKTITSEDPGRTSSGVDGQEWIRPKKLSSKAPMRHELGEPQVTSHGVAESVARAFRARKK